jgi:alkanesulfonate monooxygenase SsuD/methylene tetrahydromethanopterin reductase-like flavin-dependent oxidoreductase (luciferase family)
MGTGVIDMLYENPLYMAEDAGAADLISRGRLQLGMSRGSPESPVVVVGSGCTKRESTQHDRMRRRMA